MKAETLIVKDHNGKNVECLFIENTDTIPPPPVNNPFLKPYSIDGRNGWVISIRAIRRAVDLTLWLHGFTKSGVEDCIRNLFFQLLYGKD